MPNRLHLTAARMRYAGFWRITVALMDGIYGTVFLLGGSANSAYQILLKQVFPIPVFSAALVVVAALLLSRALRPGGVLGAVVWSSFAIASLVTVAQGSALSAGGPVLLIGIAVFHLLITYGAAAGLSAMR